MPAFTFEKLSPPKAPPAKPAPVAAKAQQRAWPRLFDRLLRRWPDHALTAIADSASRSARAERKD